MLDLILLTYENRSGSTLLAKELNSSQIICCPESDVLMNAIVNDKDIDLSVLLSDYKIMEWSLSNEMKALLKNDCSGAYGVYNFLSTYAKSKSNNYKAVLLKGTEYLFLNRTVIGKLEAYFKSVVLLNIVRDPVSIYNSQVKSIHSKTGLPMENSVVRFYKRIQRRISTVPQYDRVINVSFEELLDDRNRIIESINQDLGYEISANDKREYYIGESQRHLHQRTFVDKSMVIRQEDNISKMDLFLLKKLLQNKVDTTNVLLLPYRLFKYLQWRIRQVRRFVF